MRQHHIRPMYKKISAFEKKMFTLVKFDSFEDGDYFLEKYLREKHPKEDSDFIFKKRSDYVVVPERRIKA